MQPPHGNAPSATSGSSGSSAGSSALAPNSQARAYFDAYYSSLSNPPPKNSPAYNILSKQFYTTYIANLSAATAQAANASSPPAPHASASSSSSSSIPPSAPTSSSGLSTASGIGRNKHSDSANANESGTTDSTDAAHRSNFASSLHTKSERQLVPVIVVATDVESGTPLLTKESIRALMRQVDQEQKLDMDVEDLLVDVAADFAQRVIESASKMAKHRHASTIELKDIQFELDRNYDIRIPGYGRDIPEGIKRRKVVDVNVQQHLSRVLTVREAIKNNSLANKSEQSRLKRRT